MDIPIISLGAILILAAAGACFRAASLRARTNKDWSARVTVTEAGLREISVNHLINLHVEIEDRLVQEERFDPAKVIADPSQMVGYAKEFLKAIGILERIQRYFRWLLALGPIFLLLLVILELGLVSVFGHLGNLWSSAKIYNVGVVACTIIAILLIACFGLYAYLQHALSKAESLAEQASNDD